MTDEPELLLTARRFRVVRHREIGNDGREHVKETVQHPGAVTILPILDDGRVCLIRNWRVAVGKTLVELPAGTLEPDEDPAANAARELIEETGFRAASIEPLREFTMSPGILNERMHLYLATGLTPGETALEAGERIEPLVVSWEEAMGMVDDGTIEDAKTLVGLMYYDRVRGK
ncbi:MAG: NUDIX hydrolase [Planctomycetota bacterium]|nr:MAG: NUDIX hydrolase [Planctomycetota bacterium]